MDKDEKTLEVSTEERTAEEEALVEAKEDDIRAKLASELGIDPDEDNELLDKLTSRELAHKKALSGVIKQKRSWREKAQGSTKKDESQTGKPQTSTKETPDIDAIFEQKFQAKLEERDLQSLDLPEELEEEVKKIAKIQGISIREASKDSYFLYKKQEFDKAERIRKATPKRKGGSTYSIDPNEELKASDYDLSTKEGRDAWEAAKKAKKQANS